MSDLQKSDDDMQALESLLGQSGRLVAGVTVQPLKVAQLPRVLKAMQPIMQTLREQQDFSGPALAWMCTDHPDAVLSAVAAATATLPADLSDPVALDAAIATQRAWLSGQSLDVLMELTIAVVEVNGDFFLRSPALASLGRLTGGQAGMTISPA